MNHLAIIPDGNRRWAKQHKLETFFGHKKGMDGVRSAITVCIKNDIKYLSFYTFSLENQHRSAVEKEYLFKLISTEFLNNLSELIDEGVRVRFLGDQNLFPLSIHAAINEIETQTAHLEKLHLNLLFFYGGQQDLVQATKRIAQQIEAGSLTHEDISVETIKKTLWTGDLPDPELIIRTGKIYRLSNFFLYQAAYSEFMFLDAYWPEATEDILQKCINDFDGIKRNFGA